VSRFCSGYSARSLVGQCAGSVRVALAPNFPIKTGRRPKFVHLRSGSKFDHFVHSSLLSLQRGRLRKSELDKKAKLFFETTCIWRSGTQPPLSRVTPASVHKSTPAPKMDSTVRQLQRTGGNSIHIRVHTFLFTRG
jgi:hypothetical protein